MKANRIAELQQTPMFGAVDSEIVRLLVSRARRVEVSALDYFFRQGDEGRSAWVLEEGHASVFREREGEPA